MNWLLYRGEKFNPNFFYQSGVDIDHSFLLVGKERRMLLVPEMNKLAAEAAFEGEVIAYRKKPLKLASEILKKSVTLGLDLNSLCASCYLQITREFKKTKDISKELSDMRRVKGKKEVTLIKKAAKLSRTIIDAACEYPEPTEEQTARELLVSTYAAGAEYAFKPIVASAQNSAKPHSTPTNARITNPLLIDYGTRINHYNSDTTRCSLLTREQEKIYKKLKRISARIIDEVPNFKTGGDLGKFTQILYKKEGLIHPPHCIGHGIGLAVHESPSLAPSSKDLLAGATFAIEPAVYFPGEYGLRYENVVYFDGKRARIL